MYLLLATNGIPFILFFCACTCTKQKFQPGILQLSQSVALHIILAQTDIAQKMGLLSRSDLHVTKRASLLLKLHTVFILV